jgi:predicted MPP superfamily phosphohydrolase
MLSLRAQGRGRNYSPWRGLVESTLRVLYVGGWPGALWGRLPGTCEVRLVRDVVAIPGLRRPLRLGFASDLHLGPTTPDALLERAFAQLAAAELDLLVLGGDYVFLDATPERAERLRQLVASIPAKTKVAVLGNHDLWTHHALLEEALTRAGAEVLVNRALRLPEPHAEIAILGLDEPWTGQPDASAALAGAQGAEVVLAVAHAPEGLRHLEDQGISLLLCGHTHGGQIALPGHRPVIVPGPVSRAYPYGRHEVGGTALYVSRGLGGIEVPVRAWAPPDVLVLELRPG